MYFLWIRYSGWVFRGAAGLASGEYLDLTRLELLNELRFFPLGDFSYQLFQIWIALDRFLFTYLHKHRASYLAPQ